MKVIFACAGTGGHINPAIAIANKIKKEQPESEFLFIGTQNGLENKLVANSNYEIKHIRTGKILRKLTLKNVKALVNAYSGIGDAKKILKEFKPDVVIGTGGYICIPVMLAAKKLKIPYILHESNAFPGLSVKVLAKKASKVMLGFKEGANYLKNKSNIAFVGTPAKFSEQDIENLDKAICKKELGLDNGINKKIILVTCGSQGARRVNNQILDLLNTHLDENLFFVLVTGETTYDEILQKVKEIETQKNIDLSKYIKLEKFVYDMNKMYKVSDMCITRAGAMTVTELEIAHKVAILIPLPSAAENHQYYNAKVLSDINAGILIEEKDLNSDILYEKIKYILDDNNLNTMTEKVASLVNNSVDDAIYNIVLEVVNKG